MKIKITRQHSRTGKTLERAARHCDLSKFNRGERCQGSNFRLLHHVWDAQGNYIKSVVTCNTCDNDFSVNLQEHKTDENLWVSSNYTQMVQKKNRHFKEMQKLKYLQAHEPPTYHKYEA